MFLGQEVDDQIANLIIAELLYLEAEDPERDISLYINSPGGLAYAGMAIYDVIQHIRPDVSTVCVGMGMSAAAMVLCGGAPGKRLALPSAKIMIHQGSAGARGAPRDMEIQLREVLATTRRLAEVIAHHTGRPVEQVEKDLDRDYFMTAQEAMEYGLIDEIIVPRRGLAFPRRRPWPDRGDHGSVATQQVRGYLAGNVEIGHRTGRSGQVESLAPIGEDPGVLHVLGALARCPAEFERHGGLRRGHEQRGGSGHPRLRRAGKPTLHPDRLAGPPPWWRR